LPTGYIPVQDQAKLYCAVQLPDSASMERTQEVVDHITDVLHQTPGVAHTISVAGQSFTLGANGSNFGNMFVTLDDFDRRREISREMRAHGASAADADMSSDAIAARLRQRIAREVPEGVGTILGPPPVAGLGNSGGFKIVIEDRSGSNDLQRLQKTAEKIIALTRPKAPPTTQTSQKGDATPKTQESRPLIGTAADDPAVAQAAAKVASLFTVFRANTPQLYVELNRDQCQTMGVNPNDVFTALQVYLGSLYVNDFNKFGRTWQVVVQAEGSFRNDVDKIKRLKVRSATGGMVPLGAVTTVREIGGPILLMRYNMYPAAAIVGSTAPGVSSGEGIDAVQRLCDSALPNGMAYEWTEINFIQIDASKNVGNNLIFPLAVVLVFLVLAAQYESWALPLAVILVVPMCILSSLVGVFVTHSDINIFTQIGFVVLVGLASKNAILIVEFAKHKREAGQSRREATLQACRLRLRPILMTSFAFILGVVPLMVSSGAGH